LLVSPLGYGLFCGWVLLHSAASIFIGGKKAPYQTTELYYDITRIASTALLSSFDRNGFFGHHGLLPR
jgi:hypothetical protein